MINVELYRKIFPFDRVEQIVNRERKQLAQKSFEKQLLVKRLPINYSLQNKILEFCFHESHVAKHKKLMRKIVYLFNNAFHNNRLKWMENENYLNTLETWRIDLSRISPGLRNSLDLPPPVKLGLYMRNHFVYTTGKYSYLTECTLSGTNCIKCGQYIHKRMAHHYREFDNPKKEHEWYSIIRKKQPGIIAPYYDRLWCNCKSEIGEFAFYL